MRPQSPPQGHYSLRVDNLKWTPEQLNSGVSTTFSLTITNEGEMYDGCLYFQLKVKGDKVIEPLVYLPPR